MMRFCPVLLLLPTVLLHFSCEVLAPRVPRLEPEKYGLPDDPFGLDPTDGKLAEGIENLQLSSSSGHNFGVGADSSHGASGSQNWQQYHPVRAYGNPDEAHHVHQYGRYPQQVGYAGYQHGGYVGHPADAFGYVPSNARYQVYEHGQGAVGLPQYAYLNQHDPSHGFGSGSFGSHPSFGAYPVDHYGRQTARGQLAITGANTAGRRGKQTIEAYHNPATYGGHHSLESHDPNMVAAQSPNLRKPVRRGPRSHSPPFNPAQVGLAKDWVVKQLSLLDMPNLKYQAAWQSLWNYRFKSYHFGPKESKILFAFLRDDLVRKHAEMWVSLYEDLKNVGDVPTLRFLLEAYKNPFALADQVIPDASPLNLDRIKVYHSAIAVHASYRLRARIRAYSKEMDELDEIRRDFTKKAPQDPWPDIELHSRAASLAAPFIKKLDNSKWGYMMFTEEEKEVFKNFSELESERAGQGST